MIALHLPEPETPAFYRLAGRTLAVNAPLVGLEAFATPPPANTPVAPGSLPRPWAGDRRAKTIYAGPGWLVNAHRTLHCLYTENQLMLAIDGLGRLSVDLARRAATVESASPELAGLALTEVTTGPLLALFLAADNVFLFHASAARWQTRLMLFMGDSGRGKSTLAAFLGQCRGWQRVADDIVPLEAHGSRIAALPGYPQLKLPEHMAVPSPTAPLPVRGAVVLAPSVEGMSLEEVRPQEALTHLVQHSVAARLLTPDLLRRHFDFCARVATEVPLFILRYPHRYDCLPDVRVLLEKRLR